MAASHVKSLLLISFCFLALKCALEPNKPTSLNGIPSRWNLATQIMRLGISGIAIGIENVSQRELEPVMRSREYHITIIARQLSTTSTFVCQAI